MVLYVLSSSTGTTSSITTHSVTTTKGEPTTQVNSAREATSESLITDYTIGTTTDGTATIAGGVNSLKLVFVMYTVTSILLSV